MIYLYSGTPGSGKSLHTASKIYWWLRNKRPCICNFAINTSKIYRWRQNVDLPFLEIPNDEITPEYLIEYAHKYFADKHRPVREGQLLLVLDECQLLFNSREWQRSGRQQWLSFFSQHRKYGYDIILVAQFDRMIDRQIRSLIEYEYIHRKVSNFGIKGKIFSLLALGNLFVCVKMWYPLKERIGAEFFRAHKRYYSLYDTFGDFSALEPETETDRPDGG